MAPAALVAILSDAIYTAADTTPEYYPITHPVNELQDTFLDPGKALQQRDEAIAVAVGSSNVGAAGSDVGDGHANAAGGFGDEGALLPRMHRRSAMKNKQ
eukprot:s1600_g11.t1